MNDNQKTKIYRFNSGKNILREIDVAIVSPGKNALKVMNNDLEIGHT